MFLSIDIGGTKTLLALFSFHGLCLRKRRFPTTSNPDVYLSDLKDNLEQLLGAYWIKNKILALTVAIPGKIIVTKDSYNFFCPNIAWTDINLYPLLKSLFNCPIFFANDANLATLYESSKLSKNLRQKKSIYLTFSTGIGGGISENGMLLPRSDDFEPGHKKYLFSPASLNPEQKLKNRTEKTEQNSSPKTRLEWEDIASAKTLTELYHSKLTDLSLTPEIKSDIVSRLALGLKDIISSEHPASIIIGGPLGFLLDQLKDPLLSALSSSLDSLSLPLFLRAKRPTESVIYGAYLYSKSNYKK